MHRLRVQDLLESEERPSGKSAQEAENATKGSPTETKYFVIEFIHDTICPFCYIGMRNLIVAIETYKAKHPDAVFEVTCTPFLLAPAAESSCKFLDFPRVFFVPFNLTPKTISRRTRGYIRKGRCDF